VFPNHVFPNQGSQNGVLPFQFSLWDDPVNTNAEARMAPNFVTTLTVSNGFFSTLLDFGDVFNGRRAFLEVQVYAPSNTFPASSNWITISPRTEIGAVPYAMWARRGGTETMSLITTITSYGTPLRQSVGAFTLGYGDPSGNFILNEPAFARFPAVSARKHVEEARIMVSNKRWSQFTGQPSPCSTCGWQATLEVWRETNAVENAVGPNGFSRAESVVDYGSLYGEFVRTLTAPTNLVLETVVVGQWLSLEVTNALREINPGEFLQIRLQVNAPAGAGNGSERIDIRGNAMVRDAR
jgi:hypothetical protein